MSRFPKFSHVRVTDRGIESRNYLIKRFGGADTFVFDLYCVSIGIQITLDKTVSSDLLTHRYEIRDCGDTSRATPRL
jgi:hypothetical protein